MAEIRIPSGVSWLHDHLVKTTNARIRDLEEVCGLGRPNDVYLKTVGAIAELKRMRDHSLPEMFAQLGKDEDYDTDDEEEEV